MVCIVESSNISNPITRTPYPKASRWDFFSRYFTHLSRVWHISCATTHIKMYNLTFLPFWLLMVNIFSIGITIRTHGEQNPLLYDGTPDTCDCHDTKNISADRGIFICGDRRLGPIQLPKKFPYVSIVSDYDRFGGKPPGVFLKNWWNTTSNTWFWPKNDGFYLDQNKNAIKGNMVLSVGTLVDRFGHEGGMYRQSVLF